MHRSLTPLFTTAFLVFCLAGAVRADDPTPPPTPPPCKYDWLKLEANWNEYLMDASAKTAGALIQTLHTAKEAREKPQCEDRARVRAEILGQIERLDRTIKMAGTRVPEILQALLAQYDGVPLRELDIRLGKSAELDPIGFLDLIQRKFSSKTCPFVSTDSEEFNDVDPPSVALVKTKTSFQNRLKQIKRVLSPRLKKAKAVCISALTKAIAKSERAIVENKNKSSKSH